MPERAPTLPAGSVTITLDSPSLTTWKMDSSLSTESTATFLLKTPYNPDSVHRAVYTFDAPAPMKGVLWMQGYDSNQSSPFSWRIGNGPIIAAPLVTDGSWQRLGPVEIGSSGNKLELIIEKPCRDGTFSFSPCLFAVLPYGDHNEHTPTANGDTLNEPKRVYLWDNDEMPFPNNEDTFRPFIMPYLVETESPHGAVLIAPGGAFLRRATHEGEAVARYFNSQGWHAFVLHYRVAPSKYPAPFHDAVRAARLIRHNAFKWFVKPNQLAFLGFSAGGHILSTVAVHGETIQLENDKLANINPLPNAMLLSYPVVSFAPEMGNDALLNDYGGSDSLTDPEKRTLLSIEKQLSDKFPPTFLWHCFNDNTIPLENSLTLVKSLRAWAIPFEFHVFPRGGHGRGLSPFSAHNAKWLELAFEWLKELGW